MGKCPRKLIFLFIQLFQGLGQKSIAKKRCRYLLRFNAENLSNKKFESGQIF